MARKKSKEVVTEERDMEFLNDQARALTERLMALGLDEQEILASARKDMNNWQAAFGDNIKQFKDDTKFCIRDQWTTQERSEFTRLFKPAMTFNKIYDAVRKIIGEQEDNTLDMCVRSINGLAKQEQLDLRADLLRTISYDSQTKLAQQNAFRDALIGGFGALEVSFDYQDSHSFNRTITVEHIIDPTTACFDPKAKMKHKADGDFCSSYVVYTKDEFRAKYPWVLHPVSYAYESEMSNFTWQTTETITVAKYTRKEFFPVHLLLLSNGDTVTQEEFELLTKELEAKRKIAESSQILKDIIESEIPYVVGERIAQDYVTRQYLLTQNAVIDFQNWPSKYLPLIFVDGDSTWDDGKQITKSIIHDARDAQRYINYVGSESATEIKNRRREQWVGTPANIKGMEPIWRQPELQNGILLASPDPKTGAMPQKMQNWEMPQTLLTQFQRGSQDIREIMGFSEADQVNSRDISGSAKRERKLEASKTAMVYMQSLSASTEQMGRVIVDLMPFVAGSFERVLTRTMQDGTTKDETINKRMFDAKSGQERIENILEDGDFDVEIIACNSFSVQKEIALEFFTQTLAVNPQLFPLIADLWAKNLDLQNMPQLVERFKSLVPPQIIAKESGEPMPPQPPNPQEQMAQMQLQQQQQALQLNAQKMQIEEAQLAERAEELKIRKEKHLLEQAQMLMKSQELMTKSELEAAKLGIEQEKVGISREKMNNDMEHALAKLLADIHKQQS